ncbi:GntR family transcriptional regulator [Lactiplantibacillus pentosus]|uniref:GntR family transcriptional regulator n=1 Tax=Lactiplantibacillus pentosus TaxID=1589 RepID=A0AAX6LH41_LACPE|nr:GntR family transcriptional regulator [Lactiplantibacillus pentosus]MDF2313840.1 GntR family transcriptional regulator [Lactiplantibacillus pentosus]
MAKYEILFKQLRMAILRGEYAPNDRLPSENAIAIKHESNHLQASVK